jgi:hypothetical protein
MACKCWHGGEADLSLQPIRNLGTRSGWVVTTIPWPPYPLERLGIHFKGGWEDLRAGLDGEGKSHPHWDLIPGPSSP